MKEKKVKRKEEEVRRGEWEQVYNAADYLGTLLIGNIFFYYEHEF